MWRGALLSCALGPGLGLVAQASAQGRAVSVELPPKSLGFYVIQEDWAWGLETSFAGHAGSVSQTYPLRTPGTSSQRATSPDSIGASLGLVYQRPVGSAGPVTPFVFAGPSGSYGWGRHSDIIRASTLYWELSAGAGVAWQPLEAVALWVRQGLALSRRIEDSTPEEGMDHHKDVVRLRLAPPTVLAVLMW